ncbi:unnamed protein product [Cochlearia groenlandica]
MCLNNLLAVLCFVLAVSHVSAAPQCGNSLFFRPNSMYDTNRRLVLSTLASNVSSRNAFYNVSIGQGPERIYALGLCIPGTDPKVCSECIRPASADLLQNCPNQTDSWDWRADKTLCFVRYSNSSFFNRIDLEPTRAEYLTKTEFRGYPPGECETCINENVRAYQNCCNGFMGGSVRRPVCYFRWDGYAYLGAFNVTPSLPPPPPQQSQPRPFSPLPPPEKGKISIGAIVGIVVSTVTFLVIAALGKLAIVKRRQSYKTLKHPDDDLTSPQSLQFDFATIEAATDRFSMNNKFGQGGLGEVYKGMLHNDTEIAVKRLSRNSGQGTQEFKNEVVIVAKLQHKNLVRLLGKCCSNIQSNVDPKKKTQLDSNRRYNNIGGITRGIFYLHQDSRLTIIHRDIKASNILLDAEMNPKIADFGMARNFRVDQTEDKTRRVVGTFGYMPPEYVSQGQFSTKCDVYSFGVLILEIVSGKKNSSFYQIDDSGGNLVTHVWRLWNNDSPLDLIDPAIRINCEKDEVIRCIHIGLLCVQETPADRPAMSIIFQMLTNSSIVPPTPRPPGFFMRNKSNYLDPLTYGTELGQSSSKSDPCSIDSESITRVTPR